MTNHEAFKKNFGKNSVIYGDMRGVRFDTHANGDRRTGRDKEINTIEADSPQLNREINWDACCDHLAKMIKGE